MIKQRTSSLEALNHSSLALFGLHYIELTEPQQLEITMFWDWAFNKYPEETVKISSLAAEWQKIQQLGTMSGVY